MVTYGIGIVPLIKIPEVEFTDIIQPWYADDAGALVTFAISEEYFYSLKQHGLGRGYYPNPQKEF